MIELTVSEENCNLFDNFSRFSNHYDYEIIFSVKEAPIEKVVKEKKWKLDLENFGSIQIIGTFSVTFFKIWTRLKCVQVHKHSVKLDNLETSGAKLEIARVKRVGAKNSSCML